MSRQLEIGKRKSRQLGSLRRRTCRPKVDRTEDELFGWREVQMSSPCSRITRDLKAWFGKPRIRGLRVAVASVLSYLGSDVPVEEMLAEWPVLKTEDPRAALSCAAFTFWGDLIRLASGFGIEVLQYIKKFDI